MIPGLGGAMVGGIGAVPFSATFLQVATSLSDSSSYNFGSKSIGAAPISGERRWIVIAATLNSGSTTTLISGVTLGGNAVTEIVSQSTSSIDTWIGAIEVTSGTAATPIVTLGSSAQGLQIAMFRLINWSGTVHDTASNTVSPITLTIDVPHNGLIVACCSSNNASPVWTNVSEIDNVTTGGGDYISTAYYTATAAETPRAVEATAGGSSGMAGCAASFG